MSYFREMKTNLKDEACIVDALKQMGYKPEVSETPQTVRGHYNEGRKAEIVLRKEDIKDGGDIGLQKGKDGNYKVIADTYVLHKFKLDKFSDELTQKYGEVKSVKIAKLRGFTLKGRSVDKNGVVKLTFTHA